MLHKLSKVFLTTLSPQATLAGFRPVCNALNCNVSLCVIAA